MGGEVVGSGKGGMRGKGALHCHCVKVVTGGNYRAYQWWLEACQGAEMQVI